MIDSPSTGVPKLSNTVEPTVEDVSIGQIIRQAGRLSAEQVEQVLAHQRATGLRFGEAAVALGLVERDEVLRALAQQFHYPYAPADRDKVNPELVTASQPFSRQAESFRAIRTQVLQRVFTEAPPHKALAVISPDTGDGKTYLSANLAVVLSQMGARTLLVDADLRGPRQHQMLGVENSLGLSGLLSGRAGHDVIRPVPDLPSLFVLPGGAVPPNPTELIERPAFSLLLHELRSKFDYVLLDTPAACYGVDASAIALKCGAALCVVRQGHSHQVGLTDLMSTISGGSVLLAGAVMNEF